jgi:hypothetical protein
MIKCFGLEWKASEIDWKPRTKCFGLLGHCNGQTADFSDQRGVYALYGKLGPQYVGLADKTSLGDRLRHHYKYQKHKYKNDPENFWDRFSWFGVRKPVVSIHADDTSVLEQLLPREEISSAQLIHDLEALLIMVMGVAGNSNFHCVARPKFQSAQGWKQVPLNSR